MRSGGEMGVGLAPGLSRKLKKVLESGGRAESADLVASLSTLSEFYDENTPTNRRNLRSTIETRSLSINLHFLEASGAALASLDRVEAEVDSLVSCCDRIAAALSSCSHSTADIVSATERLRRDLDLTAERQRIVSAFLSDFQLSPAQMKALREDDLSRAFFDALSHAHRIHANCKLLLRTHHQRAGLDLMDMMAVYQEAAYERLCRWVQAQCRQLGDSDHPEVSDLLEAAVRCLRERPVLFKYCAEEVANMRHNALFRRFITALTRGGPGGMPRPIEVHAHDPLRYVGDMLGWLHQALASEREFVTLLLHPDEDDGRPGKVESDLKFVMDRVFEGVCRPFKVRVEQVFQSQPNLIISCKLSNTLEFYCHTISDLLGKETALSNTLLTLKEAAQKTFFEVVKIRGEKLVRYPPLVAVDLSPPPAVREGVSVLLEIIETHDSMMAPASAETPDFDPIISALLNPIIQMCEQAAEAHKSKGVGNSSRRGGRISAESDSGRSSVDALLSSSSDGISSSSSSQAQVFLINCLCAIQQPLLGHEVAAEYAKNLGKMIDDHLRILVRKEVDGILGKCGLLQKMHHFQEGGTKDDGILSQMDDTSPAALSECLKAFFQLILASESSLPEFELVQVPRLRSEASVQVAKSLAEAYEVIHDAIVDPKNGYPEPKTLARHPPHQIRTILGI